MALALALHILLGSLSLVNRVGLTFFYYYPRIIQIVIFEARTDLAVWAASILCASALITTKLPTRMAEKLVHAGLVILTAALASILLATTILGYSMNWNVYTLFLTASTGFVLIGYFRGNIFDQSSKSLVLLSLVYLLSVIAVIEISSGIHYSLQAFDVNTPIGGRDARIELQLSYASYGLLPWLYAAFLFSWAWVPVARRLLLRSWEHFESNQETLAKNPQDNSSLRERVSRVLDPRLFLALALAVFIGYYPYFQSPPWIVGTDAYWRYYDPLVHISGSGPLRAFANALSERHPVPLMILYAAHIILQTSLLDTVRFAQLLLVAVLGLSVWWFLGQKKNYNFGLNAFLLSVLSITTAVGFYASIMANWMALFVWVLFFAYLNFRSGSKLGVADFATLLLLSTLLLFIHPWTWGVFAAAVVVTGVMGLIQEKRRGLTDAGVLLAVIAIDVALAFFAISYMASSQGWRVLEAVGDYTFAINHPASILSFWDALTWLTRIWSPFFSPLYFAVSILGVFCLSSSSLGRWGKRLIFAWLFVSAVGSIMVAPIGFNVADPSGSETQLWRLLFITPYWLLAPFGITWLSKLPQRIKNENQLDQNKSGQEGLAVVWLGLLLVIGVGLAWADTLQRVLLILFALPVLTGFIMVRSGVPERKFLSRLILIMFILVAFNNTTRALSQVLRDPHNYRP